MKILMFNSLYYPNVGGGAEVVLKEQAEALAQRGHNVVVVCTYDGSSVSRETINGVAVVRLPFCNRYWLYKRQRQSALQKLSWHLKDIFNRDIYRLVTDIIAAERPDLAICHNLSGLSISVWEALNKFNVKIVQFVHDQYMACVNSTASKNGKYCVKPCLMCSLFRLPHKHLSGKVHTVVGVSKFVLDRFVNLGYYANSRQLVLRNARSFALADVEEWSGAVPLRIGYIGNISRVKGVDILVDAYLKANVNATLTVAGIVSDDAFLNELKSKCVGRSDVRFYGFVEAADFYKGVDIVVIPSVWPDTFPTVAFEACAHNVPVLASRIGGLPEIVNDSNGALFEPGNVTELSELLAKSAANPALVNKWKRNACASVSEMTDVKRLYDRLEQILSDVYNG